MHFLASEIVFQTIANQQPIIEINKSIVTLSQEDRLIKKSLSGMIFMKRIASSGNRTRAARVAGEHSTTEPTMLMW